MPLSHDDETDFDSPTDVECQRNIFVSAFNRNMNVRVDHNNMRANNDDTDIFNRDCEIVVRDSCTRNIATSLSCVNTEETINCHDENRNDETDFDSLNIDCQNNILVPAFNRNINVTMDCDNMNTNINETDILNKSHNCTRNVDASLSCVNTEELINYHDENRNDETDFDSPDIDCQNNILVPAFNKNINVTMDCDNMNTNDNETDINKDHSYTLYVDLSLSHVDTEKIINYDFQDDYDVMIPITYVNAATDMSDLTNQKNNDAKNEQIEVSVPSIFSNCDFRDVKKAVKRLTFNTIEKSSEDAEHVCVLPICLDNPEIVDFDVPVSHDNDNDEDYNEDSEYIPSEHSSLQNQSPQDHVSIVDKTTSSISSYDTSNINVVGTSACNDEVMYVQKSNVKSTKQNYCAFCMKLQSQLA
ncbi:AP2/ERF domain-containing protein PFD0985w-like [Cataglyphis hispanica]|uniref:AP2/ERF domain-containing protein PFD0985w-like n=1 Tax=Cataglyphis hispanica TaxID=1086592 RepID=UPI00217F46BC|nr:AP2/ERF domain-containing protein PFD0985w-like [Cataglyphis hispanica]